MKKNGQGQGELRLETNCTNMLFGNLEACVKLLKNTG